MHIPAKNIKFISACFIILIINLLFTVKYFSRYSIIGIWLGFAVFGFQILVLFYDKRRAFSKRTVTICSYALILLLACFAVGVHFLINPVSLNIDRWSVIDSFFTELFKGDYPYFAKSTMGNYPGPMPFYFAVAAPFYLIGESAILSLAGYVILIFMIIKNQNKTSGGGALVFLILSSLFVYWEIATRSNIFSFSIIILLGLKAFLSIDKEKYDKMFFFSALITGLLLSTRAIFILPYIVVFLSTLIKKEIKIKSIIIYGLVSLAAFICTFLPFAFMFREEFLVMNPFIVQSSFLLPAGFVVLFVVISIALSFCVKNESDKYFYGGTSLFIPVAIYFVYQIVLNGFEKAFYQSNADISYFLFCLPFLFYYIMEHSKEKTQKSSIH